MDFRWCYAMCKTSRVLAKSVEAAPFGLFLLAERRLRLRMARHQRVSVNPSLPLAIR